MCLHGWVLLKHVNSLYGRGVVCTTDLTTSNQLNSIVNVLRRQSQTTHMCGQISSGICNNVHGVSLRIIIKLFGSGEGRRGGKTCGQARVTTQNFRGRPVETPAGLKFARASGGKKPADPDLRGRVVEKTRRTQNGNAGP